MAWHRELLRRFELDLRDPAIGNKPDVTIPYWIWNQPFPRHLDDNMADDNFMGGAGTPVTTGPFRQGQWTPLHGPDLNRTNASAVAITSAQIGAVLGISYYDAAPWNSMSAASMNGFRNQLEGLHDTAHGHVGGQMGDPLKSPDDPVFWLHHAYVDFLWAEWERLHPDPPTAHYLPTDAPGDPNDDDAQMTPWPATTTPKSVKETVPLGYIYLGGDRLPVPAVTPAGLIVLGVLMALAGVLVVRRTRASTR